MSLFTLSKNVFTRIKETLSYGSMADNTLDPPSPPIENVSLPIVSGALIYPSGLVESIVFPPECHVEKTIHSTLGEENRLFHVSTLCTQDEFRGYEAWHDSTLYDQEDLNRKATHFLKTPLYGTVLVMNRLDDATYQPFCETLFATISRALPPKHQSKPLQRRSKSQKRYRDSFRQPNKDNTQSFSYTKRSKKNNDTWNEKEKVPVRRSSRILKKKKK